MRGAYDKLRGSAKKNVEAVPAAGLLQKPATEPRQDEVSWRSLAQPPGQRRGIA